MSIIPVRAPRGRRAMTLLELLLALALCGLLMTATGASLHLMIQLRARSQTQISETQTIRAVLDRVARDLRSVRRISDTDDAAASSEPRLEQDLDLRRTRLDLQAPDMVPVELSGTATWLSLQTDSTDSALHAGSMAMLQGASQSPLLNHADGLHVIWWNGEPRMIPYAGDDFRILETRVQGLREVTGPSRVCFPVTQQDERPILFAEPLTSGAQIRFRYFDGVVWRDSWDSTECRCLPRAVECRVTLGRDKSESIVIAIATNSTLPASQGLSQQ